VLIIARISTVHQDVRSLADQIALCEAYVRDRYAGPINFIHIQGRGSGELLDRKELLDAEAAIESRQYDLVIVEDLGRICRRHRAFDVCEQCEDAATRLIAINDTIDTARDDWRLNALFASFRHESSNKETSRRICRTQRHRFEQGGLLQFFIPGVIVPPGARGDTELLKDERWVEIYEEWWRMLELGVSYSAVADWLNRRGVPVPPRCRNTKWDCRMVRRISFNPLLKGIRERNRKESRRVNKMGRKRSVAAPPERLLTRFCPNLVFIQPERYDRVIADRTAQNAVCARGRKAGTQDGRAGVPKKRTMFPGQHIDCGVCGRPYLWGGHGQTAHLMCAGARDYACWNAATFDGHAAGPRLAGAVLLAAESLPEFDDVFRAKVEAQVGASLSDRDGALRRLERELSQVKSEMDNLTAAIARKGFSDALERRLDETEARAAILEADRLKLVGQPRQIPELPCADKLRELARAQVGRMEFDDPVYRRLMHDLAPRILVFPYQLLDGGQVVLRAELTINLAPLLGPAGSLIGELTTRRTTVDLFDEPQRAAFLGRVVALRAQGHTEKEVARQLKLTVTAAQRAMALNRLMLKAGVTDPYRLLTEPSDVSGRLRRHLNPRYEFRPLDGFPAWPECKA
jgi:DNA invertase Pin-like site-specific DNA recombinase